MKVRHFEVFQRDFGNGFSWVPVVHLFRPVPNWFLEDLVHGEVGQTNDQLPSRTICSLDNNLPLDKVIS